MAEDTPKSNIPFSFGSNGYTFGPLGASSSINDLRAAVQVFDTKQTAYTYLKYCERYIVGYTSAGVQIIKGRCYYGGIRDVGGFIRSVKASQVDLGAQLIGKLGGVPLYAYIGAHPAYSLFASIRGFVPVNFLAFIRGVIPYDLPASVYSIGPVDLPAELRPYYQLDFPGNIHGWQAADLGATIDRRFKADLGAWIGVNKDIIKLNAIIKGWVRAAQKDLTGALHGFEENFLPAFIRGTEYRNLTASMIYIQPVNLLAQIHGWQEAYLGATIDGENYRWNLPAYLNATGEIRNLGGHVMPVEAAGIYRNLMANIIGTRGLIDLPAYTNVMQANDLGAYLNSGTGRADLLAYILPKRMMLTGVLSIITMNHYDLSAIVNVSCFGSEFRDLSSYINLVYKQDLGAYIKGYRVMSTQNLGARTGWEDSYYTIDKLPISAYIFSPDYRVEDKISLLLQLYRASKSLSASIVGTYQEHDLGGYIAGVNPATLGFTHTKNFERIYHRDHYGQQTDFQDVYITFEDIIQEYFFNSFSGNAWSAVKEQYWLTEVSSYYSEDTAAELKKRLHKVRTLYNMRHFKSIDKAIKYAIEYVTTDFYSDMNAMIECSALINKHDLNAVVYARRIENDRNNLTSNIVGTT